MRVWILIIFFLLSVSEAWAKQSKPDIPIQINPRVNHWIKVFQRNKKSYFNSWLVRSEKKLPKIKALLKRRNLPVDLAYLPLIESGLNPKAVSSAQAVGYWQFIKPTALFYGLEINWWLDERHDLIKSTWAAAQYLDRLYDIFGDWYLALSGYNMGETRLRKLIKRHKTKNFWKLSRLKGFPKETRDYVPKYLAATIILKNPSFYGFKNPINVRRTKYSYQFVPGGTDLYDLSRKFDISSELLKELNPELKRYVVPKGIRSHRIRVPENFRSKVSLYLSKKSETF